MELQSPTNQLVGATRMDSAGCLSLQIIVTLLCWGAWGIFDKKALEHSSEFEVMFLLYALSVFTVPVSLILLNVFQPGWNIDSGVIFWSALASLSYLIAQVAYLAALRRTEASYVLGITASYPLVLQLLSTILLHETLVPARAIGSLIIAGGIALVGSSTHNNPLKLDTTGNGARTASTGPFRDLGIDTNLCAEAKQHSKKTAVLCIEDIPDKSIVMADVSKSTTASRERLIVLVISVIASISWGFVGLMDKQALAFGHPLEVYLCQRSWDVLVAIVLLGFMLLKRRSHSFSRQTWTFCGLSELSLGLGSMTYLFALATATASYVITITGCYPLFMYFFALLFLKERFNFKRCLGIALIVCGGIAVQLTMEQ
jgi:drug/metabolite transporter (DMT)-like permease